MIEFEKNKDRVIIKDMDGTLYPAPADCIIEPSKTDDNIIFFPLINRKLAIDWRQVTNPLNGLSFDSRNALIDILVDNFFFLTSQAGDAFELKVGNQESGDFFEVDEFGHEKKHGKATVWEDENFDPTMLTGSGSLPTRINIGSTNIGIAGFSGSQLDAVDVTKEYPHKAKLSSDDEPVFFIFHGHMQPSTTTGGNVRLGVEYMFTRDGVVTSTSTTLYTTISVGNIAWMPKTFEFAPVEAPKTLGEQLHFRFFRIPTDPLDTYVGTLGISTIGFHYEIDSDGSNEKLVK